MDEVIPAAMPALDAIRPQLAAAWTARENARLLSAKADELSGRLRRGDDIAAVAASVGATVSTQKSVGQSQQAAEQFGQETLAGLFSTAKNQVFSQPAQTGGIVIGRVDAIYAATPALAAPEAVGWRQRMEGQIGQTFLQAFVDSAAARLKAGFDEAQARIALGLEPKAATPAAGAPATK
ncbi:MAG: hypothetical protein EON89_08720 [Brevundimonas sp.]|nr:MAG: hypothetical protein EON89_08720 [Brevundimonas sp.]